jgi:GxxExxY protein
MDIEDIRKKVIGIFYHVYNKLGYGFLEKIYEEAMKIELHKAGLKFYCQYPIEVYYDGKVLGNYVADFVVEDELIVEIKACKCLCDEHEKQLLNYLRCTDKDFGLLLNFGTKAEFKKKIYKKVRTC